MDKVLIVEDDREVNRLLCELLQQNGYETAEAYDGLEAIRMLGQIKVDLVLLDLMLPGLFGEEVLNSIKASGNLPVIIVSAKNNIQEKVQLLKSGADDYITKPFHREEVIARIEACLRRFRNQDAFPKSVRFREIEINVELKTAQMKGVPLSLTSTEYKLLEILVLNPQKTFSKKQLFKMGWKEKYLYHDDVLNTHISNLRKKIKNAGSEKEYIETVFGLGYRLYSDED